MTRVWRPMSRRSVLIGLGSTGALVLTGCDRLSEAPTFRDMLASGEKLTMLGQRPFLSRETLAREYPADRISQVFRANGSSDPSSLPPGYADLLETQFARWRLVVDGLVHRPLQLSLAQLRALPARSQITRHDCVEGWSCIGEWTGTPLAHVLLMAIPKPEARYAVFHCADPMTAEGDPDHNYYESLELREAAHPQTILAYGLNGKPLPVANGAPVRLRAERQLGYKQPKYIQRIELVSDLARIGGGKGGYWEDLGYTWWGGI